MRANDEGYAAQYSPTQQPSHDFSIGGRIAPAAPLWHRLRECQLYLTAPWRPTPQCDPTPSSSTPPRPLLNTSSASAQQPLLGRLVTPNALCDGRSCDGCARDVCVPMNGRTTPIPRIAASVSPINGASASPGTARSAQERRRRPCVDSGVIRAQMTRSHSLILTSRTAWHAT